MGEPVVVTAAAPPVELLDAIRQARSAAILGHVNPDADCLGAMGALAIAAAELGVEARLSLPAGTVARRLQFLLEHGAMQPAAAERLATCDVAIVLDTARQRRVNVDGPGDWLASVKVLNVDHHASNPMFGAINWVDATRSSTSEMTHELIKALGCAITPTIATLLYAGIHSDTGGFSLSNTTPSSLEVAHRLAQAGARIPEVCERLHRGRSRSEFELIKLIFANTRLSADGRLAWSSASYSQIKETGCNASDVDDQVEVPRSVEGIRVALLLTEGEPGVVRVNFRGESGAGVIDLARQFGGGGHYASAGAMLRATLSEAIERVIPAAEHYVATLT